MNVQTKGLSDRLRRQTKPQVRAYRYRTMGLQAVTASYGTYGVACEICSFEYSSAVPERKKTPVNYSNPIVHLINERLCLWLAEPPFLDAYDPGPICMEHWQGVHNLAHTVQQEALLSTDLKKLWTDAKIPTKCIPDRKESFLKTNRRSLVIYRSRRERRAEIMTVWACQDTKGIVRYVYDMHREAADGCDSMYYIDQSRLVEPGVCDANGDMTESKNHVFPLDRSSLQKFKRHVEIRLFEQTETLNQPREYWPETHVGTLCSSVYEPTPLMDMLLHVLYNGRELQVYVETVLIAHHFPKVLIPIIVDFITGESEMKSQLLIHDLRRHCCSFTAVESWFDGDTVLCHVHQAQQQNTKLRAPPPPPLPIDPDLDLDPDMGLSLFD